MTRIMVHSPFGRPNVDKSETKVRAGVARELRAPLQHTPVGPTMRFEPHLRGAHPWPSRRASRPHKPG
jgi:hypothetical protein